MVIVNSRGHAEQEQCWAMRLTYKNILLMYLCFDSSNLKLTACMGLPMCSHGLAKCCHAVVSIKRAGLLQ